MYGTGGLILVEKTMEKKWLSGSVFGSLVFGLSVLSPSAFAQTSPDKTSGGLEATPICSEPVRPVQLRNDCDVLVPAQASASASLSLVNTAVMNVADVNNDQRLTVCLRHDTTFTADASASVAVRRNNVTIASNALNKRVAINAASSAGAIISAGMYGNPGQAQNFSLQQVSVSASGDNTGSALVNLYAIDARELSDLCFDLRGERTAIKASSSTLGALRRTLAGVRSTAALGSTVVDLFNSRVALVRDIELLHAGTSQLKFINSYRSTLGAMNGVRMDGTGTAVALSESTLAQFGDAYIKGASAGVTARMSSVGVIENATFAVDLLPGNVASAAIKLNGSSTRQSEVGALKNLHIVATRGAGTLNFDISRVGTISDSIVEISCAGGCFASDPFIGRSQVELFSSTAVVNGTLSLYGTADYPAALGMLSGAGLISGGVQLNGNAAIRQTFQ